MADAVGLIVGVASFVVQVATGIENLRSTIEYNRTQAPEDLASLCARLEFLHLVLDNLQHSQPNPQASPILVQCRREYDEFDAQLNKVLERFTPNHSSKRQPLMSKARKTLADNREKIESLNMTVSRIIELLMLFLLMPSALHPLEVPYDSTISESNERPSRPSEPSRPSRSSRSSRELNAQVAPAKISQSLIVRRRPRASCNCAGSSTSSKSGNSRRLHYSAILFPQHGCDSEECIRRKLLLRLKVSLVRFGFPRVFTASLEYITGSPISSIKRALTTQQIVRNTSPVFAEIWRCKMGFSSFEASREALRSLFKADSHFQRHADAEGHSYLWHLVRYGPWYRTGPDAHFKMLELFVTEFNMSFSKEDPSLLIHCAKWIGEGHHLDLLDSVLEHGLEPYESVAPAANEWPKPCDDNWISLGIIPDPFFLEYFRIIVEAKPGFSGITDFQVLLLSEQYEKICMYLSSPTSRQMVQEVNFLQQTSLHMAVGHPLLLNRLIDFLGDKSAINAKDHWDFTPLMYAAASGHTESAVMLISRGANPFAVDRQRRTFLTLAIARGHWELLMAGLNAIRLDSDHRTYQTLVRHALEQSISRTLLNVEKAIRRKYVVQLILQCDEVNVPTFDFHTEAADKILMSCTDTIEEAMALVGQGFTAFNRTDDLGQLPIHSLIYNLDQVKLCLDHGTDVNHVDKNGDTLILTLLSALSCSDWRTPSIMKAVALCVERGADYSTVDKCRCPCSPNGCSSSSVFSHAFERGFLFHEVEWVWSFEWVSILEDYRGEQAAREVLCSLIRRIKFDQLGMTHVCCHDGRSKPVYKWRLGSCSSGEMRILEETAIDQILEVGSENIQILDQVMEEVSRSPLKELRKKYMLLLYEEYSKHEANFQEIQAKQTSNTSASSKRFEEHYIDYEADDFVGLICWEDFLEKVLYPVTTNLATYVGNLEYVLSMREVCQDDTHMERHYWYRNRLRWLVELMDVFKISLPQIRESIRWNIVLGDLESGQQEKMRKVLEEHFTASVRSMRGCMP